MGELSSPPAISLPMLTILRIIRALFARHAEFAPAARVHVRVKNAGRTVTLRLLPAAVPGVHQDAIFNEPKEIK